MKLLTVTVPCYNSQDYMEKCIQSLLPGGNRVEIIIIDDGSKDCLLYTSPSPRDTRLSRMPSSA